MGQRAAVVGATGYTGGELLRLIAAHPALEVGPMVSASHVGERLGDHQPQLPDLADERLVAVTDAALDDCDVVFLALPHGASAELARTRPEQQTVIDLGADFRLRSPADWDRYYGGPHAGTWEYGLPELPGARERLRGERRIANPGCFATAQILALAPLLAAAVVSPEDLGVVAASGTSGAGRAATTRLLGSEVMGDVSAYQVGGVHRHLPEVRQALGDAAGQPVTLSFTPLLAPMPRGILATCTARLLPGVDGAELRAALADAYGAEPLVALLPEGSWPHTAATSGAAGAQLQVVADLDAGRAVVVIALDNLGKGAAAQAVQNANLSLGLPETAGLSTAGIAP